MKRYLWLIPLLAAAAAYAIAPWGDRVWDDDIVVTQQLVALHTLADVLQPPAGIPQWSYVYYRPMTVLSYLLDTRLFGSAAAGPHAMNVLYHLLTTGLVWLLARRLLRHLANGQLAALAAATLFAVHPIHTESVSWITGRSDVLATLLLIPALLLALQWRDRGSIPALLVSPVLLLLALLAKEVAIAGLAILPLLWLAAARPGAAEASGHRPFFGVAMTSFWAVALCWLAATWSYFALRQGTAVTSLILSVPLVDLVWLPLRAAAWYAAKLLVPWPQSNFVGADALPGAAVTLGVAAIAIAALAWAAWRWRATRDGGLFLGLWWTGVAIAPSLAATLPGLAETAVAERYLYLPSVGLALALGALLGGAWARQRARTVAWGTASLAAIGLAATLQRGSVWLTDLRLWTDTTGKVAAWAIPWVELGRARYALGDQAGALEVFLRARDLRGSPKTAAVANFNVGLLHAQRGNMPDAERAFSAAVAADPTYARGHYGLGGALYERALASAAKGRPAADRLEQLREAAGHLERAVSLNPAFAEAHVALGWVVKTQGDVYQQMADLPRARASYAAALGHIDAATRLDPAVRHQLEAQNLQRSATLQLQRLGF